jgi:carnitine 3-dehydrogenase
VSLSNGMPPAGIEGVRTVTCVGTGLIGARWAALFAAAGLEVTGTDVAPDAQSRMNAIVAAAWPALKQLGLAVVDEPPAVGFDPDLERAVASADWVQESVLEHEALKLDVIGRIDAAAPAAAVIASSTSGILPSVLQSGCVRPERVLVGHPFNPAHIMPLVEVVAGAGTSPETVARAMRFYAAIGKRPLHCRTEAPGFIANRLQEAVWREMFHLVNDGIATTGELDAAIADGPGLRWAFLGPAAIYMLQGGDGGFAYALEQFTPEVVADCSHNFYPELTPELKQALDEQTRQQLGERSIEELEALRDEFLVRLIRLRDGPAGG